MDPEIKKETVKDEENLHGLSIVGIVEIVAIIVCFIDLGINLFISLNSPTMMDGKPVSFSIKQTVANLRAAELKKKEKPIVTKEEEEDYIEYITHLEDQTIKVATGPRKEIKLPDLVIPMKPNTSRIPTQQKPIVPTSTITQVNTQKEPPSTEIPAKDIKPVKLESHGRDMNVLVNSLKTLNDTGAIKSLDDIAARELIEEANAQLNSEVDQKVKYLKLPVESNLTDGQKESTLEDYNHVPIEQFGLAMLRGMGWKPGSEKKYEEPQLRAKGLGLGADKSVKGKMNAANKADGMKLVKGSFVKIVDGKHTGSYGKVVGFDEDSGRAMVNLTNKNETISVNEFVLTVINKMEYEKMSKVINAEKYEQYKMAERHQTEAKQSSSYEMQQQSSRDRIKRLDNNHSRSRRELQSGSDDDKRRVRRKKKKRYSSESSSSNDKRGRSHKIKSSRKSSVKKYQSSSESEERGKTEAWQRDSDKKRKGKKKKRDRSRSPNYRKYRK